MLAACVVEATPSSIRVTLTKMTNHVEVITLSPPGWNCAELSKMAYATQAQATAINTLPKNIMISPNTLMAANVHTLRTMMPNTIRPELQNDVPLMLA